MPTDYLASVQLSSPASWLIACNVYSVSSIHVRMQGSASTVSWSSMVRDSTSPRDLEGLLAECVPDRGPPGGPFGPELRSGVLAGVEDVDDAWRVVQVLVHAPDVV